MEGFQKIVLITAVIILVVILIVIGVSLAGAKDENWPPLVPECPDFWTIDGSGNNTRCINVKDLGVCPPRSGQQHLVMNFNLPLFTGSDEMCQKYKWASNCGVSWDGITYGRDNPCNTTTTTE